MKHSAFESYSQINDSFLESLKYKLGTRGFYSEVCGLLNAAVYCYNKKKRLLIDDTNFSGFHWRDFFKFGLPTWDRSQHGDIEDLTPHVSRRYNVLRHRFHIPVFNRHDGRLSSIFSMQSSFAKMLCEPVSNYHFTSDPYVAVQLRRGDKTNGYVFNGQLKIESTQSPIEAYVQMLRRRSEGIRYVFVLTDDYRAYEELKTSAPEYEFHTNCQPSEFGYVNDDFQKMDVESRKKLCTQLVSDVHICGRSEIFIGPFKSNPSRFVPLLHGTRRRSFSVDANRKWKP
jgi:hypothetical protein